MFPKAVRPLVLSLIMLMGAIAVTPGRSLARQTTPSSQEENRFASEQYGYVLEWGPPWESFPPNVQGMVEGVILTAGNKMAGIAAVPAHGGQITFGSAAEVLEFVVDGLVANVRDATVAIEDRSAPVPWAELTYTGPQGPARSFVEVFSLDSAGVYLYSIVEGPNAEFEEALMLAAEGIRLDGKLFVAQERAGQSPSDANGRDFQDTDRPSARGGGAAPADETDATASYGGGPAHTGEQPGPAPAVEPGQTWTFATGDTFIGTTPAVVSAEHGLVFTSSSAVYAIDIPTGEEVWSFSSTMGFIAPPALDDGVLYAAGEDGSVYAFEPETGAVIWQSVLTGGLSINGGPLVDGDTLYVTAWDGTVKALTTETGNVLWSTPIGGISFGQPAFSAGYVVLAGPGVGNAAFPGMLAIEASSGDVAWTFETAGPVFPVPAISDGVVYFGGEEGILYAVDLQTGKEIWSIETGAPISAAPAVSGGVVHVVNGASVLGAYDALSGNLLWTGDIGAPDLGGISVTRSEDGTTLILVGDGLGDLHAFDAAGTEVYAVEVAGAKIVFPVTVVDGVIYVSSYDGTVYALSTES